MSAHVLVVDDETLIRQSLQAVLIDEGFEVTAAGSLADAWAAFEKDRPDIVLLDLVLGDGNGLDLLRRIKGQGAPVKVVVISAHGSFEHAVSASLRPKVAPQDGSMQRWKACSLLMAP